jgi:hypothetical protein
MFESALYFGGVAGLSSLKAVTQYTSLVYSQFISTEHENYFGTLSDDTKLWERTYDITVG